ncbi:replication-associated recombination protein A [Candidatus Saccharibacteria bacterium]|nr:replication-associated recombination protein A [Candidatus Saccharibacteria bacterium]
MENERVTPLAERMRPRTLDEVVGQDKAMGLLKKIVAKREPVSLIFWGPPGAGKTTLARIVARETEADFVELSAVTSGKKDIERIVERARANWNLGQRTILFVDEIHRFNKAQQDAFLPHVESGLITLIGATTENPSFEVISPLISRTRVIVLEPLARTELAKIIERALSVIAKQPSPSLRGATGDKAIQKNSTGSPRRSTPRDDKINPETIDYLAEISAGDARVALGTLEVALGLGGKITKEKIEQAAGKKLPSYDKKGDGHYDNISAFIKSMRAGDDRAALFYLARMVAAGEDPKFIARRMVIFASEDIGLAGNGALDLALNAFMAVERIGMPESEIILSHVVVALARGKKSRESYDMWGEAKKLAAQFPNSPVPIHVRNAPTKLMKDLGFGAGQKWVAGFKHDKPYLPEDVIKFLN